MLVIVPHELGHALSARVLGWHVFAVALGWGRTLCRFRLAGFPFEFKVWPIGGYVMACPKELKHYRWKSFLIVLAGAGRGM